MHSSTRLSFGARMNGALSLFTGVLLAAAPDAIGDRLGLEISPWLSALGVALLAHAAALEWVARRGDPAPWVRLNLAIVAPYPIALVAIAASSIVEPVGGEALLLLDGACVAVVAAVQWSGLRQNRQAAATLAA